MQTTTVNIELLQKNVLLTVNTRSFNNNRKADLDAFLKDSNASTVGDEQKAKEKKRMKLSKQLLISPELEAIREHLTETYNWAIARSMPSGIKDGIYLAKLSEVPAFKEYFETAREKLFGELVPAFQAAYPAQKEEAKAALNGQYKEKDYPSVDALPGKFGLEFNFVTIGIPDSLPAELRAEEAAKMEAKFKNVEEEIFSALREGFAEIVAHVTDRLTVEPGQKPKIFRNSLFEDLTGFISTFSARNMVNDTGLESLVNRAQDILKEVRGNDPAAKAEAVRDGDTLRESTAAKFAEIKKAVDGIIAERPSRKFDLSE